MASTGLSAARKARSSSGSAVSRRTLAGAYSQVGDALLPVEFRVDVAAARQQQAVTGQRILHGLFGVVQLDPAHLPRPGQGFRDILRGPPPTAGSGTMRGIAIVIAADIVETPFTSTEKPRNIRSGVSGGKMGIRTPERFLTRYTISSRAP